MAFVPPSSSFLGLRSLSSSSNSAHPECRNVHGAPARVVTYCGVKPSKLSETAASESPAIKALSQKYIFPMRDRNTQVFFDNAADETHTLAFVFAQDRHGLTLDIQSVMKALNVHVTRIAGGRSQALQLVLSRCEGEIRGIGELGLNLSNCVVFWIQDLDTRAKIYNPDRIGQIVTCIKFELGNAHPRPKSTDDSDWHRIIVEKNRADRYTSFNIQTRDRSNLLMGITAAFANKDIDIASATIGSYKNRIDNIFMVTKKGYKEPLTEKDTEEALEEVMKAILQVGAPENNETLWYQTRDGSCVLVSEALFVDEVNNTELAGFTQHETPNFRGRLPGTPYQPVSLQ